MKVMEFLFHFLGLSDLMSESESIAGGTETDGLVGVFHRRGKDCNTLEHEALGFLAGEFGGLLVKVGQFLAEVIVFEPAVQCPAGDFGLAGGL